MNRQTDIGKRVEKTLESLDGIQKAETQPYFFTRLKARLERDNKSVWEVIGSILARPAIAVAGLCLILALNVFILIQKEETTTASQSYVQDNMPAQEDENIFVSNANAYDYENLEP